MEANINATDLFINMILNNTRLTYDKDELKIDNDTAILELIKVLAKPLYEERLKKLQEKENKENKEEDF